MGMGQYVIIGYGNGTVGHHRLWEWDCRSSKVGRIFSIGLKNVTVNSTIQILPAVQNYYLSSQALVVGTQSLAHKPQ